MPKFFNIPDGAKPSEKRIAKLNEFKAKLADVIDRNGGIATVADAHACGSKIFKHFAWSTQNIEEMSRYIMSCPEFNRIDLIVSKDGKKKVRLFPEHHPISSTSFFARRTDDPKEGQKLAELRLQELKSKAEPSRKKSATKKKEQESTEMIDPKDKSQDKTTSEVLKGACHATRSKANGFISSSRVRMQMIHTAIVSMYQYAPFTVEEFVGDISLAMYMEIVGIEVLPKVVKEEPKLLYICMKYFPSSFLKEIGFDRQYEGIKKLLTFLSTKTFRNDTYIILSPRKNSYSLMKSLTIDFLPDISFTFKLGDINQAVEVWRAFALMELLEFVDPQSNPIWRKRHSFTKEKSSNVPPSARSMLETLLGKGFKKNFPMIPFSVEPFLSRIGFNYANLEYALIEYYNGPRKKDLKSLFTPKHGPISLFCSGHASDGKAFFLSPKSVIETVNPESFGWVKDVNAYVALNYFVALYCVSPTGVLISTTRNWLSIYDLIKEYGNASEEELSRLAKTQSAHMFSISYHNDYRDLFAYNTAAASYPLLPSFLNNGDTKCIELSTTQYNSSFLVNHLGFRVESNLGEIIERMRIISLCPPSKYSVKAAEKLLTTLDTKCVAEAVLYLKLTKFLSLPDNENAGDETTYRFSARQLNELRQHIPLGVFGDILRDIQNTQKANHMDPLLNGMITSAPGSYMYLMAPNCKANLYFSIDSHHSKDKLPGTSMTSLYAMPAFTDLVFDIFSISISQLQLPSLPDFLDLQITDFTLLDQKPRLDFRLFQSTFCNILHQVYMQTYVAFFQVCSASKEIEYKTNNLLFIRLIYSFLLFRGIEGASLSEIINYLDKRNFVIIVKSILFLEEYGFIMAIHSTRIMPHFVTDTFSSPHCIRKKVISVIQSNEVVKWDLVKPHYWISIDGNLSPDLVYLLSLSIYDIVRNSPGIEFIELADRVPSLSISDLSLIIDVMEADEVISTTYLQTEEGDLFSDNIEICVPPLSNIVFLYEIAKSFSQPTTIRTKKLIFPTPDQAEHEALVLLHTIPSKMKHAMAS